MASKALATTALFLSLNLLFITIISATYTPCPPSAPKSPKSPTTPFVPKPPSQNSASCPIDALKLGVCADVVGLVNAKVGSPPTLPCCSLIEGLVDLEAAACLCIALKANVLGLDLNIPLSLSIILNNCGRNNSAFQCL